MKRAGPRRVKTLLGGSERELPRTPQDELCQACRWSGPRRGHRKTEGQDKKEEEVRLEECQGQGGATGRQRVRNNNPDKEEEEVEAGRRPGCGERVVIGQFSINKLKIITKTHVSVFFLGQN